MAQIPTIGRIALYRLNRNDVALINRRSRVGPPVHTTDIFPMIIVRVLGDDDRALVNGQVLLDGVDTFWACAVNCGSDAGMWSWPMIQPVSRGAL